MSRWRPFSGAERAKQSRADKQAMVERLRPTEPAALQFYDPLEAWNARWTAGVPQAYTVNAQTWTEWATNNVMPVYTAYDYGTASASYTIDSSNLTWYEPEVNTAYDYQSQFPLYGNALRTYIGSTIITSAWSGEAWQPAAPISQEEADRRLAATRARQHKDAIKRKKAIKKGRKLLLEVLTDQQKTEYAKTKSFTVNGADGKRYRLRKSGTTHQLDDSGLAIFSHCIHLPYSYIDEDTLVAVKLLLETDPKKFFEIANTSRLVQRAGVNVPNLPQEMIDRATALSGGLDAINARFAQLSIAAAQARNAAARLGRAFEEAGEVIREHVNIAQGQIQNAADYADYARECEHQLVAEDTGGLDLPFTIRQNHASRILGHAEDIAGVAVAA